MGKKRIITTQGIEELSFNECYERFKNFRYKMYIYWDKKVYSLESEDLLQEIEIAFYKAYENYDVDKCKNASFQTYVTKIINNEVKYLIRKITTKKRNNGKSEVSLNESNGSDETERIEMLESDSFEAGLINEIAFKNIIETLPDNKKLIIEMLIKGYSEAEIAIKLNVTKQRVNKLKNDTKKILMMGW